MLQNLFETYELTITAPAINIIIGLFLWHIAYFGAGFIFGRFCHNRKLFRARKFWRDAYYAAMNEVVELRHIKSCYAPEWDSKAERWRDGRTGEFVDHDDVIPQVKKDKP